MIPVWYALAGMATTAGIGAVATHLAGAGRRARLLKRTARIVVELRRLSTWVVPAEHWEAGTRDTWSLPLSPRLTDQPRITAAKAEALTWRPAKPGETPGELTPELRHAAAPAPTQPDWHRGEHRIYSWGWAVEVAARLLNFGFGKSFVWDPAEHKPADPKHAAWNVDTQALEVFVAEATEQEKTRRRDLELEALTLACVAKGLVLR